MKRFLRCVFKKRQDNNHRYKPSHFPNQNFLFYLPTFIQIFCIGSSMISYYFKSDIWRSGEFGLKWYLCVLFTTINFALWAIARIQLTPSFSIFSRSNGPLITHGIYSKFSNPIYLFSVLTFLGYLLLLDSPMLFLSLLIILPIQIIRAKRESIYLENRFGDDYRIYLSKVWF
jgi:protein-S-isoprenylcysteine O-methyltransferase Ste14